MIGNYRVLEKVGVGSYGAIHSAIDVNTHKIYALKIQPSSNQKMVEDEVKALSFLQSQGGHNLIHLYDSFKKEDTGEIVLVFDYANSDLAGLLQTTKISPNVIKNYMYQILSGLSQLEKHGYMHRDIKPANILIKDNIIKLCDFGSCVSYRERTTFSNQVCTLWYRAPELLLGCKQYQSKVDIWSAGCVFVELMTRMSFIRSNSGSEEEQLEKIFKFFGTPKKQDFGNTVLSPNASNILSNLPQYPNVSKEYLIKAGGQYGYDLLSKMFCYNPQQRASATELLNHPFFKVQPLPANLEDIPKYPDIHTYTLQKDIYMKQQQQQQQQQLQNQQQQQQRRSPQQTQIHSQPPQQSPTQSNHLRKPSPTSSIPNVFLSKQINSKPSMNGSNLDKNIKKRGREDDIVEETQQQQQPNKKQKLTDPVVNGDL